MDVDNPTVVLLDVDCGDMVAGVVYGWLCERFSKQSNVLYKINKSHELLTVDVVVLIACKWEALIEARQRYNWGDGVYVCGACFNPMPEPLTDLPNFTIHSGIRVISDLLYDVEVALKERITT